MIPDTIYAAEHADYTRCPEVQQFIMELADGRAVYPNARAFLGALVDQEALIEWANHSQEYRVYPVEERIPRNPFKSIFGVFHAAIP